MNLPVAFLTLFGISWYDVSRFMEEHPGGEITYFLLISWHSTAMLAARFIHTVTLAVNQANYKIKGTP